MTFVDFNRDTLYAHISLLNEDEKPIWGNMTAQQMIEHLIWSIQVSIGEISKTLVIKPENLERSKQFLMSNRPMPRDYKNRAITPEELEYTYSSLDDAKDALLAYYDKYEIHFEDYPDATYTHPTFGELNHTEWNWMHQKHITHHFEQFSLLEASLLD